MLVTNVSNEDGLNCAALINAINAARFSNLSGKDIDALVAAKKWLHDVATKMAVELKNSNEKTPPKAESTFRVKSVGQLPAGSIPKPVNKKKK